MAQNTPPVYRGFQGSCIYSDQTGLFYGHVINVRESLIPFRFSRASEFKRALQVAVDAYLMDCRLAGLKPEKPVPPGILKRRGTARRHRSQSA